MREIKILKKDMIDLEHYLREGNDFELYKYIMSIIDYKRREYLYILNENLYTDKEKEIKVSQDYNIILSDSEIERGYNSLKHHLEDYLENENEGCEDDKEYIENLNKFIEMFN